MESMLDEKIISMLEATSEILNLEANVVEKDYYVTQVIHALSTIKSNYFQLIFAGGTCLSKAHKLVKECRRTSILKFK